MSNPADFTIENGVLKKYVGPGGDVVIPDSVTAINSRAFKDCKSLKSVTIPDSVTAIGYCAFDGCTTLTSVVIPDSVIKIDSCAFPDCTALSSIEVASGNPVYHGAGNCLIETTSKTLVLGCGASVIPTDGSVTTIGGCAFSGCTSLTSVTIPAGVTVIGTDAFRDCKSLTSITIPDSVTKIGDYAFDGCAKLTSASIPHSVTEIGDYAFCGCESLTSVVIPDSVTKIGESVFKYCSSLTDVVIGNGVTEIGPFVFEGCPEMVLDVPNVETYSNAVFGYKANHRFLIRGEALKEARITAKTVLCKPLINYLKSNRDVSVVFDDGSLAAGEAFVADYAEFIKPTEKQLACFLLYQKGNKWIAYLNGAINNTNANGVLAECVSILKTMKKLSEKQSQAVADTALNFKKNVDPAVLHDLSTALTALKHPNDALDKLCSSLVSNQN